jgi:hypothetical protein
MRLFFTQFHPIQDDELDFEIYFLLLDIGCLYLVRRVRQEYSWRTLLIYSTLPSRVLGEDAKRTLDSLLIR